ALPAGFGYADTFALETGPAAFRALGSITLSETQNRFVPAVTLAAPFASEAELTVPADALTNSALRFSAAVQDRDGTRRSAAGTTTIAGGAADPSIVEFSDGSD